MPVSHDLTTTLNALRSSLDPPEMTTSQLLLVSSLGLGVNLFGMFAMGGHHHHHVCCLAFMRICLLHNNIRDIAIPMPMGVIRTRIPITTTVLTPMSTVHIIQTSMPTCTRMTLQIATQSVITRTHSRHTVTIMVATIRHLCNRIIAPP